MAPLQSTHPHMLPAFFLAHGLYLHSHLISDSQLFETPIFIFNVPFFGGGRNLIYKAIYYMLFGIGISDMENLYLHFNTGLLCIYYTIPLF